MKFAQYVVKPDSPARWGSSHGHTVAFCRVRARNGAGRAIPRRSAWASTATANNALDESVITCSQAQFFCLEGGTGMEGGREDENDCALVDADYNPAKRPDRREWRVRGEAHS